MTRDELLKKLRLCLTAQLGPQPCPENATRPQIEAAQDEAKRQLGQNRDFGGVDMRIWKTRLILDFIGDDEITTAFYDISSYDD